MDKTQTFILSHRNADIVQLALQAKQHTDIDLPWALQQIAGWQMARQKIPTWADIDNIQYPPHLSMEQCSSEATAKYKAQLARRLCQQPKRMIDLTGGLGVDTAFMSDVFNETVYVEANADLCRIAQNNFKTLRLTHIQSVCADATSYIKEIGKASLVYIDPARRSKNGARTYAISDCTPDILTMKSAISEATDNIIVKLSPMLDWHLAVQQLNEGNPCVSEVHIVSVKNECKELLFVMQKHPKEHLTLYCINDNQTVIFHPEINFPTPMLDLPKTQTYLYEPNASIMKSGCFAELAQQYNLKAAGKDSHLFFADDRIEGFPGRVFQVLHVCQPSRKHLLASVDNITQANITVRNFPLTAQQLRKKLKLKDGGDLYIFATTLANRERKLLVCTH